LAARRANIKEIILCKSNQKDILEIKEDYIRELQFHYVTDMREVIDLALLNQTVDDALDLTIKEDKKPVLN
jgi:ATP-dependent Lon protease